MSGRALRNLDSNSGAFPSKEHRAPLDDTLRALVEDVVRRVVREELAALREREPDRATNDGDRYMAIAEVAEFVGVSANTVRAWTAKSLPVHRIGRVVRIKRADLDRFLRARDASDSDPDQHAAEILARRERR